MGIKMVWTPAQNGENNNRTKHLDFVDRGLRCMKKPKWKSKDKIKKLMSLKEGNCYRTKVNTKY